MDNKFAPSKNGSGFTKSVCGPLTEHLVYIHAGFDGTGQTTLQKHFLIKHPDILCLGKPRSEDLISEIRQSEIAFDENIVRTLMASLVKGDCENKTWVISDDNFSNNPPSIGMNAMRLRAMFPNARIMFTIRNQIKLITSWYAQGGNILRAPKPYHSRHVSFENFLAYEFGFWKASLMAALDFDKVIGVYEDLFGIENVRVFVFEDFIADKTAYLANMCAFFNIAPSPDTETFYTGHAKIRPSARDHYYRMLRSYLFPGMPLKDMLPGGKMLQRTFANFVKHGQPVDISMPDNWQAQLSEIYSPGNRRLSERYGLALDQRGYPI